MSTPDLTKARLMVASLAPLQWLIIWLLHYLPVPAKNPVTKIFIPTLLGLGVFGLWSFQITLYSSIGGVRIPGKERFFMGLTFAEYGVVIGLLCIIAFERRKRELEARETNRDKALDGRNVPRSLPNPK